MLSTALHLILKFGLAPFLALPVTAQAAAQASPPAAAPDPATRPNILFLFSDDQRADALGAAGNPYIRTPHLDRLVDSGFHWREAHIMGGHHGAICAPSRAMLLSGRQLFRVYDRLDGVPTFPARLAQAGYATFATGKWHQSQSAFKESFHQGRALHFGGMADHFHTRVHDLEGDGSFRARGPESENADSTGFSTELFADAAIEFLQQRAAAADDDQRPFLAYVSFTAPHDPRTPPPEFAKLYRGSELPLPPDFMPLHPLDLGPGTMTVRDEALAAWPRDPWTIREQLAEYYGLISHLDAQIGRILATLEETGQASNTIVVFASDNGLALGSHGLLGKQSVYEHSTRVPLVIAGPGIPHGSSDALVYLFDLAPTLVAWAGAEPLEDLSEARDLSPILFGERVTVRDQLYTVYRDTQRAVRDARWKLVRYPRLHLTRLYDLERDPLELRDLSGHALHAERLETLTAALEDWHQRLGDPHPLTALVRDDPLFEHEGIERKPDRWQPESVRKKYFGE